ncbi:MAG: hypothetical protein KJN98_00155 [Pontiella sp.]|nr:hypothetical protein [Pontiella sp.]
MAKDPTITTSAPGSLMLLGEHAVLHGHKAMVCAINRRITIRIFEMPGRGVRIASDLGTYRAPLDDLVDHPDFRFVIGAIRKHRSELPSGFEMEIDSDFPADIGFGSSAAVTAATHAALLGWLHGVVPSSKNLFGHTLETIRTVQGRGSGADVAASVFGGVVGYSVEPEFRSLELNAPLTAVYCGYKTPTPEVIWKIEQLRSEQPEKYERIYSEIGASVDKALDCLRNHDFPAFGAILNRNQQLMDEMGVNTPELQEIVSALQADPDVFGAKISGSGLGDCAVGIGYAELKELDYPVHHLEITPVGCQCHD